MITSGGTSEYIDDVRILTNISSGKLGALIAEFFLEDPNIVVYYVYANESERPRFLTDNAKKHILEIPISDVNSLYKIMEEFVPKMDIVIHAMAVSDFSFEPIKEKLKSSDPEAFIESMRKRIKLNPKILPMIKKWNPKCTLVSFKLEVGLSKEDLFKIARNSMETGNSDYVVANDKVEIQKENSHIAYLIKSKSDEIIRMQSKLEIAQTLKNILLQWKPKSGR